MTKLETIPYLTTKMKSHMKYLRSLEQSSVQGESAQEKSAMNDLDLIFQIHDVVQEYSNVLWEYLNNKLTFEIAQKIRDLAANPPTPQSCHVQWLRRKND